jgi:lipid-A-disaccharide synthase
MVVAYDMSWMSRKIIGAMLKVDTVTLVNLVSDTRAVPEFLGPDCMPIPIARALRDLLTDDDARMAQLDAMAATMLKLGRGGEAPGLRAAQVRAVGHLRQRKSRLFARRICRQIRRLNP